MVYITQANYRRLLADPVPKLDMNGQDALLYTEHHIDWFSNLEAERLYLCKILLHEHSHPLFDQMIGKKWLYVFTPKDEYTHAVKPQPPRYHLAGCDCMCHHFTNLRLPVGFKETYGIEGVEAFRDWFTLHCDLLPDHSSRFLNKVQALWPRVQWEGSVHQAVHLLNSGVCHFYNLHLPQLKQAVTDLLTRYKTWISSLPAPEQHALNAHKRHSSNCQGLSAPAVTPQRLIKLLQQFTQEFKNPMRDALLMYYYQSALNSGLGNCSTTALEALGFEPCQKCRPETNSDSYLYD